ncbi:hypothetical protein GWI33_003878 [Rhynchophorus ferrugineus]|uniref:Uncharacterized protein n=1 Tax=Rhynchophorus ferrugineus TaxID=354439 RepID=A0A834IVF0_RHYFE|nr:hypothetical protein GWI33_003878 [Rhynchophorus ferrugineus]
MLVILVFVINILNISLGTIDLNAVELQYLADHLTPEECRRLVAAAHFHSFDPPNALDQAERKIPKDIQCIEHLHHWNSQNGEGKGETHELLEHRLRQMGKIKLANWLGKTVFHQLSVDLEHGIKDSFEENAGTSTDIPIVTIEPLKPRIEDPTQYNVTDSFLYALAVGLTLTILGLCFKFILDKIAKHFKKRKLKTFQTYDFVETDTSGSDQEENKFDVRTYTTLS